MSLPEPPTIEVLARKAEGLLALHHAGRPLILPNAWDVPSAKAVAAAGFPAVATSSRAVGDSMGEPDNDSSAPRLIFNGLSRIAAGVEVPVSADLQAGLGLDPDDIVDHALHAGIVGCNLEDTDHHGQAILVDAERQAAFLAAVREAAEARGVHLVINARIDTFIRKMGSAEEQEAEALRRGRLYLSAGADCVYPIGLGDPDVIGRLVRALPGPVNIIARRGGLTVQELSALGVRRISMGGGIHQLVMADLGARLGRLAAGESLAQAWPEG